MAPRKRGNGEGTIKQRKDGRWAGAVTLGWERGDDPDKPKQVRKWVYGKTRKEVSDKLTVLLRDKQQGKPIVSGGETLGQFVERWLRDVVQPNTRPKTHHSYYQMMHLHVLPTLGKKQLTRLRPQDLQQLMKEKRAAGLSPRTVTYMRNVLRQALNQAKRWGLVADNIATLVDPPKAEEHDVIVLSPAETRALIDTGSGTQIGTICAVALSLGLRQGEILGLRWQDIDLDKRVLRVSASLSTVAGKGILSEPKTKRSRRSMAIPRTLVSTLDTHRRDQRSRGIGWRDSDMVFSTGEGKPLSARNVVRDFKKLLNKAGLPDMPFHSMRHSCISMLAAQGLSQREAMELLGHTDLRLTANVYTHVLEEQKRRAADLMDSMLGKEAI